MMPTTLRAQVITGVFWIGGTRLAGQLVTWAITIVVMRLLSPGDYGLLAMAAFAVSFLVTIAEAGLGAATIQAREVDEQRLRGIFGIVILVNTTLFAALFFAAPLIAQFFEEARLVWIIRVLGAQLLFGIFAVIPTSILARALDFKRASIAALVGTFTGSCFTLALALAGYGVMALVLGTLAGHLVTTVGINIASPFIKWPDFSLRNTGALTAYGARVVLGRLCWYLYSQADVFIAGKILGKDALGHYSVSMHLASMPLQRLSSVVNQIAFPAFARIQSDSKLVASHVLNACGVLAFFAFPVFFGISSVAPEIVRLLLGAKWEEAILPLQLLTLTMPLRTISHFLPSALDGVGRADISLRNLIHALCIMPPAFLVGSNWGLVGMTLAWVAVYPLVFVCNLNLSLKALDLSVGQFARVVIKPAIMSAAMYFAVLLLKHVWGPTTGAVPMLLLSIGTGVLSYGVLVCLFSRSHAVNALGMLNLKAMGVRL